MKWNPVMSALLDNGPRERKLHMQSSFDAIVEERRHDRFTSSSSKPDRPIITSFAPAPLVIASHPPNPKE